MITLHIPKNTLSGFDINHELASARNIKDRQTRHETVAGLRKIALYL